MSGFCSRKQFIGRFVVWEIVVKSVDTFLPFFPTSYIFYAYLFYKVFFFSHAWSLDHQFEVWLLSSITITHFLCIFFLNLLASWSAAFWSLWSLWNFPPKHGWDWLWLILDRADTVFSLLDVLFVKPSRWTIVQQICEEEIHRSTMRHFKKQNFYFSSNTLLP